MSLKSIILGNLALSIIILGTITGCLFCVTPLLFIIPFSPKWCMRFAGVVVGSWMCFAITWAQAICGVKIRVFGDELPSEERQQLFVLNHRTRLDYFYLWSYLFARGIINDHKIVLKHQLTYLPAAGTSMQSAGFVFLRRNWQQDRRALERYLHLYDTSNQNSKLLIFPEGTDLRPDSLQSSNRFAANRGLPIYEYVLHPRTTGFTYLVEAMRSRGRLDAVVDMTVGYAVNVPRSELDLVLGRWPRVIDFFLTYYPISQLPTDENQLDDWILSRWKEKEHFLNCYYTSRSTEERLAQTVVHFPDTNKEYNLIFHSGFSLKNLFVTTVFTLFIFVGLASCYYISYFFYCSVMVFVAQLLVTIFFGGFDELMINYNWRLTGPHEPIIKTD